MAANIDIERLQKAFGSKGERIVIVVPGQEPLVMVPLNEYEQMSSGKKAPGKANEPKANRSEVKPAPPKISLPESIDPLQGGLADDNQYFPEPL